jgi:hypothetical protein
MQTRVKLFGDRTRAEAYRFEALRKHLGDALMLRSFQNLSIYRHDVLTPEGGLIEVICHHGFNEISIYMPPQEKKEPGEEQQISVLAVIMLGNDDVGYWYVLWNVQDKAKASGIQKVNKLEDLYRQHYPVQQDEIFVVKNAYGGHPAHIFAELSCSPPSYPSGDPDLSEECIDEDSNTYNHPLDGDITDTYLLHKYYVEPQNDDEDWWLIKEFTLNMDYIGDGNYCIYMSNWLDPIPVDALLSPTFYSADPYCIKAQHSYRHLEKVVSDVSVVNLIDLHDFVYKTPVGDMRRTSGNAYLNKEDLIAGNEMDKAKLRFGLLPNVPEDEMFDHTMEDACGDKARFPFRQEFYGDGWPDNSTDYKYTRELTTAQCQEAMLQLFSFSFVEWQGARDSDCGGFWSEEGKQGITYVAAACGQFSSREKLQRDENLEKAISDLIQRASMDQRDAGIISSEQMYKGQLNAYFTDLQHSIPLLVERKLIMDYLKILNEARKERDLVPLIYNFHLEKAANRMAVDCALNKPVGGGESGHTGSDGSSVLERIWHSGYLDCQHYKADHEEGYYYGENIAWLDASEENTSEGAFQKWKDSPDHWDNMVKPEYRETGLAIRYMSDEGYAVWVQTFGYNWYNEQ